MIKILHIGNKPAFPLLDGGCVAIKSILDCLLNQEDVYVHHYTLATHKHPFFLRNYPKRYQEKMSISSGYLNTKISIFGAIKHLLTKKSYNIERFYDPEIERQLKAILAVEDFDFILIESIYLLPYMGAYRKTKAKVVLRAHNVEHKIWEDLSKNSSNSLKSKYLDLLSKQLKEYEQTEIKKVDAVLAISEEDQQIIQQLAPDVPVTTIPTSIIVSNERQDYSKNDFYFLGAMDWLPNKEGIDWLMREVCNKFDIPEKIHLAGKRLMKNAYHGNSCVTNHGEIDDANDYISEHGICLIPLFSGSGVKIKLLENMSLGKPIITTKEGIRGVSVEDRKEVWVADSPSDFKEAMNALYKNQELRKRLGENAKEFIRKNYDLTNVSKKLIGFLKNI